MVTSGSLVPEKAGGHTNGGESEADGQARQVLRRPVPCTCVSARPREILRAVYESSGRSDAVRRFSAVIVVILAACAPGEDPAGETLGASSAPSAAEEVVRVQLEAYNRRDADAFASHYSEDVRWYRFPDELLGEGVDELRDTYRDFFESVPELHAEVTNRIVRGDIVIDHERVTGLPDGRTVDAIAIYEVREGRIQRMWLIP